MSMYISIFRTKNMRLKQRAVIEFLVKEDYALKEIHNLLKYVYGDAVVDIINMVMLGEDISRRTN